MKLKKETGLLQPLSLLVFYSGGVVLGGVIYRNDDLVGSSHDFSLGIGQQ